MNLVEKSGLTRVKHSHTWQVRLLLLPYLLAFVFYWGDFVSPLLYLRREELSTLPIALQLLQQMSRSDWPLLMAAAVLATAVPVALLLLIQPYFAHVAKED